MVIVGRSSEQRVLTDLVNSPKPEFLVVYGRRRVGKTYLIREFFNNDFAFYATGVDRVNTKEQLAYFHDSLLEYGDKDQDPPKNWREAFQRLKLLLMNPDIKRDPISGKLVVFLDELPWMDTPKSQFRPALDHFWNTYGSTRSDLLLIVCGSATSYINEWCALRGITLEASNICKYEEYLSVKSHIVATLKENGYRYNEQMSMSEQEFLRQCMHTYVDK